MVEVDAIVEKDPMDEYAIDSDEERDRKEENEKKEVEYVWDAKSAVQGELKTLLVVTTKHAGCLSKIIFNEEPSKGSKKKTPIAVLKTKKIKEEDKMDTDEKKDQDEDKEKEILKLFQVDDVCLAEI
jgi:hypothetical protein